MYAQSIIDSNTRLWISNSSQEANDWEENTQTDQVYANCKLQRFWLRWESSCLPTMPSQCLGLATSKDNLIQKRAAMHMQVLSRTWNFYYNSFLYE